MRRAPGSNPSVRFSYPLDASALCALSSSPCNGRSLDWESDSREIRYKIGPLGRKTKVGFKICVAPTCDLATALIAGNHHRKRLLQRFRAKVKRYSVKRELIQVDCFRFARFRRDRQPNLAAGRLTRCLTGPLDFRGVAIFTGGLLIRERFSKIAIWLENDSFVRVIENDRESPQHFASNFCLVIGIG
jgi:hypothetical protein